MKKSVTNRKTVRNPAVPNSSSVTERSEYNWTESFALTKHWQSDLIFFSDEMRFFRSLVDRYFLALIEKDNIGKTRAIAVRLADLEQDRLQLEKKIASHLTHLGGLIENAFSHDAQSTLDEHQEMEAAMTNLVKQFRTLKKDIFQLTEHVMESEKAKHLLGK